MTATPAEEAVLARAADLVAAFGAHDRDRYFACFDPAATFVFPTGPFLGSRAEYEREWAGWEASGWRVLGCTSEDRRVQEVAGDVVVFTHRVRTRTADAEGEHDLDERESILFRRGPDGAWTAVHEHLSPTPEQV